jgi:hypothetical protein
MYRPPQKETLSCSNTTDHPVLESEDDDTEYDGDTACDTDSTDITDYADLDMDTDSNGDPDNEHPPEYYLQQEDEFDDLECEKQDYEDSTTALLDRIEDQWYQ